MEESLKNLNEIRADEYSPLVLAYIGDAVFELYVRTMLVRRANTQVNRLHKAASGIVNATAQSEMIALLEAELTEKEFKIFKRGRNAKSHTAARGATVTDYRRATGLEALIGYLYLDGQNERMNELMDKALKGFE